VHTQTVAVNGPAHVGVAGRHDKTYDIGAPSRHASIACWAQAGSSLKESHANTNQAARFGNWAHAKRSGKDARWTFRTRKGSLFCRLWASMRISPIRHANVAYWAGAEAEACRRLDREAPSGNITYHAYISLAAVRGYRRCRCGLLARAYAYSMGCVSLIQPCRH
jgi:hypothetical protein